MKGNMNFTYKYEDQSTVKFHSHRYITQMKNTFNMIIYPTISDFHGVKRFGDFFYYSQRHNGNSDFLFFSFRK